VQLIPPRIQISYTAGGGAVVTWANDSSWSLDHATSVNGPYTAIASNPSSPYATGPIVGNVFYQLQCR